MDSDLRVVVVCRVCCCVYLRSGAGETTTFVPADRPDERDHAVLAPNKLPAHFTTTKTNKFRQFP